MKRLLATIVFIAGIIAAAESEKKADIEPFGTQEEATALINRLIKANQLFIVKMAHPLLPGKMRMWQQRGLVRYPTKMTPWASFKRDVQQFGAYLYNMLAKDPQNNEYYHLEMLRKNHNLYKELQSLDKTLIEYEPKIETAKPFQLGKESLESLQKIINAYGTRFYQDKMLEQIKSVLKGFEQTAKEIRTQQEEAQKKAGGDTKQNIPAGFDELDFDNQESSTEEEYEEYDSESPLNLDDFGFDDEFVSSFFE